MKNNKKPNKNQIQKEAYLERFWGDLDIDLNKWLSKKTIQKVKDLKFNNSNLGNEKSTK